MKTWDDFFKGLISGLIIGLLFAAIIHLGVTRRFTTETDRLRSELSLSDRLSKAKTDSLLNELKTSQARVDTFLVEITRWRVKYDTIYAGIPLMPPSERLIGLDSLTGDFIASVLSENDIALIHMSRVTNAYIGLLERDQLAGEVVILNKIIHEREGQVTSLFGVISEKNGQLEVRDAWIETLGNDNKRLRQRLFFTSAGALVLLVLLGVTN